MIIKKYINQIIFILLLLSIVSIIVSAAPLNISGWNSKTNDSSSNITINKFDTVIFNVTVTANQTITKWNWFLNGTPQINNKPDFTHNFTSTGDYIIKVNATNSTNETSNTITWNVNVSAPMVIPPKITNWGNNKTNNDSLSIKINKFDIVKFNATADQTITTWNWSVNNNPIQSNNNATFTYQFNTAVTTTIKVTATNDNGTSKPQSWTVTVNDSTPPANVTNLSVIRGQNYINWTWKNPNDTDFSGTNILIKEKDIIIINKNFTKTFNYYNTSETRALSPNTNYTITVIALDDAGNKAIEPHPNNTSSTLPNTQPGKDIEPIGLPPQVAIRFENITNSGNTTAVFQSTTSKTHTFEPLGTPNKYVNISTTANFTGNIFITINYTEPPAGFNKSNVKLYHLNGAVWEDVTIVGGLNNGTKTVTGKVTSLSEFAPGDEPPPVITVEQQPTNLNITTGQNLFFNITVNQTSNVTWKINGGVSKPMSLILAGNHSNFTFSQGTKGNYVLMVEANNSNGVANKSWNITVNPKTFFKGNRIWDGSNPGDFSLTYTWNPMSFSGFYYNGKDDVGTEEITITLNSYTDRTIDKNDLVYTTKPEEVSFGTSEFGSYQVIGFMAEKYFAGYSINTTPKNAKPSTTFVGKSTIGQGQLHKVLIDDDTKRTISVGGTLTLKEGYVLRAKDIDPGARQMLISLLKDGNEVDSTPLIAGETYVYSKKVGTVQDLPLIIVKFDSVFSGTEIQAAFLKGMFQISESATTIKTGNRFGKMEVTSVGVDKIEMKNTNSVSLTQGNTEDIMGDIKILVADNSSALRFALSVEKTGEFEVRSSVYREEDPITEWTPYNFGMNIGKTSIGFYYNLDDGVGSEKLKLLSPISGRSIAADKLEYTTSPQDVTFGRSEFGSYQVIGFRAEKYFAGYTANTTPKNTKPSTTFVGKSTLGQGQLHKVLVDDDEKRTVSVGGTLTLKEGYVLKATDIDLGSRTMLITLLKDGNEVDSTPLTAGDTYVYFKKVGTVQDLPLIMVRFESVFSGTEIQAAFLKGMFQISESATTVKTGNRFGKMEVSSVSQTEIKMTNDASISLTANNNEELMGNIRLKVADNANKLRFYFAVDVTPIMVANQLVIDAPTKANAGEPVNIKVTAGGNIVDGASVTIGSFDAGKTDASGILRYTLPTSMKGIVNITATKLGFQKATSSIEVLAFIEQRLSMEVPAKANQFESITIRVTQNGSAISGASVKYDNETIGTTNNNGVLNYTLSTSGTHTISVSKTGYIAALRDIEVIAPYSEFKALDISVSPKSVFTDMEIVVSSNITNIGTKADITTIELIINGSAVDNTSVTIAPKEVKIVTFTRKVDKLILQEGETTPGNYTIEIMGQNTEIEVKKRPLNVFLIGLILTLLAAVIIYLLTTDKGKENLVLLKEKLKIDEIKAKLGIKGKKTAPPDDEYLGLNDEKPK